MKKTEKQKNSRRERGRFDLRRRDFFKLLGGGIFVYFSTHNPRELLALPLAPRRELPKDYNAFLHFAEDGTVTCYTGKIEMGQGPITSLRQQMADELDVSFESTKIVMGDTEICPWDAGTWGSLTTRRFSPPFRAAGAEARAVLLQLASEYLDIPVSDLEIKNGIVYGRSNPKKQVSYGELAKGERIERFLDEQPPVKNHTQFHYVGMSMNHSDALPKVTGEAKYTGDMKLPGMVYARILRPPSHASKMTSLDYSEAEKIKGVEVVRDGDLVAVLHELPDKAAEAIRKVKAEYTSEELDVDDKTVFDYILKAPTDIRERDKVGNLKEGEEEADVVIESEFRDGYKAHSPIETHTALAHWEGDKVTVWGSCQSPFGAQDDICDEFDMDFENVRVISPFVGGGFGGKIYDPQVLEAVKIAKMAKKPVMLVYTREEEFFQDFFRNVAVIKIRSGMKESGKMTMWDYNHYFCGSRGADTIYNVPNSLTTEHSPKKGTPGHPLATGAWRAPHNNTNTFCRESQIDILAARAGVDPLEFRLNNLSDERMINVLKALADKFGYTPAAGPSGRGIGMACGIDAETWVAVMIEVKVDIKTGKVQPIKAACAQDMGMCVNPEGATIQVEGCITMGMGYALAEDIEFKGSDVITANFDTYQLPLFSWVPETIDTVILDRQDQPPCGGGEPAIVCMGGALGNAIFDACGARVYQMPMTPERIIEALGKKG